MTGRKTQRRGPTSRVQGSLDQLPQLTLQSGWPLERVSCLWFSRHHSLGLAARLQRASVIVFTFFLARTPHHAKVAAVAFSFTREPACRWEAKSVEAHRGQHSPTWEGRQEDISSGPALSGGRAVPCPHDQRAEAGPQCAVALFLLAAAYDGGFARAHLAFAEAVLFAFAREHGCAGPQTPGPAVSSRRASRAARCNSACPQCGDRVRGRAGQIYYPGKAREGVSIGNRKSTKVPKQLPHRRRSGAPSPLSSPHSPS